MPAAANVPVAMTAALSTRRHNGLILSRRDITRSAKLNVAILPYYTHQVRFVSPPLPVTVEIGRAVRIVSLEDYGDIALADRIALADEDFPHDPGPGRQQRDFHLHRLENDERVDEDGKTADRKNTRINSHTR